ncbi:class I SAM-dependent methyltransferase [Amycolatopsis xylanica]|uniref:class I SAM-dependent methyltransferase n=1 Tax=Amycolatopsis xylanica TaxID=589385 RepID=UPI001FE0DC22|nr:class I SAM-dependent methyltransferase [Amycolatopsis xylanica]
MDDRPITMAQRTFRQHAEQLAGMTHRDRFDYIFRANMWAADSVSGPGSELEQTRALREGLPPLLARFGVRSVLDLPCGDFGWLSTVDLGVESYLGADIVAELVARNSARYGQSFQVLDLITDDLPRADLVLCRDCLVHLSFHDIGRAIANLRRSGSRYLLTTTFTELNTNADIVTGDWRALNFRRAPFDFPEPLAVLYEECTEEDGAFADKALALWDIATLNDSWMLRP